MQSFKKHQLELEVESLHRLSSGMLHIVLRQPDGENMPPMLPGQFVEVAVDRAPVLLNRPYSIFNRTDRTLELLVAPLGRASQAMSGYRAGDKLRVIGPLGCGFTTDFAPGSHIALVGGGVGIAPMLYQARTLKNKNCDVEIIFGSRHAPDAEIAERFDGLGKLHICTDDGSQGFHGLVIDHPTLSRGSFDFMQICGPQRMMEAAAALARRKGWAAEVSLENKMACGLGACLCCVEKTGQGNVCVCKEGPVFNIDKLTWQI